MEQFLNKIFEFIDNVPTSIQFLILFLFLPLGYSIHKFITDKTYRESIMSAISIFKSNKHIDLNLHPLFKNYQITLGYIESINFDNEVKTNIFKIILRNKVEFIIKDSKEFVDDKEITSDNIIDKINKRFDELIKPLDEKILLDIKNIYLEDAVELFNKIYLNAYEKKYTDNRLNVLQVINSLAEFIPNIEHKKGLYLSLRYININNTISNCEKVFNELNGSLKTYEDKWHK